VVTPSAKYYHLQPGLLLLLLLVCLAAAVQCMNIIAAAAAPAAAAAAVAVPGCLTCLLEPTICSGDINTCGNTNK
jgi:hypothetical protein